MTTLTREQLRTDRRWQVTVAAVVGGLLLAYSGLGFDESGLFAIGKLWVKPPYDYSHGFLVVPFAAFLLWKYREKFPPSVDWPNWWGLSLLLGPLPMYLVEADLNFCKEWVQGFCLVASLVGLLVTFVAPRPTRRGLLDWLADALLYFPLGYFSYFRAGGTSKVLFGVAFAALVLGLVLTVIRRWSAVRWAVPALAMLLLSLPLPHEVEFELSWKLRRIATVAGLFVFRTFGVPARSDTPMMLDIGSERLDVQAPCSGLSMLLAFVALAAAIAFLAPPTRRLADRWVVFASSVPIAVLCNILRIVVSGLVLLAGWREAFDVIVHDMAGWAMMPIALGLVWLEFKLIDWLLVPVVRMSREEVVKAGLVEARAEIERQESARRAGPATDPHPAAPFLPLTPAGTSHGATAAGGTLSPRTDGQNPPPRSGPGASP